MQRSRRFQKPARLAAAITDFVLRIVEEQGVEIDAHSVGQWNGPMAARAKPQAPRSAPA
jgi:hypothetical protein